MSKSITRLLPLLSLLLLPISAGAQQSGPQPNLNSGDAVVTGFSGALAPDPTKPRPRNKTAIDLTFINPDGASARVINIAKPGYVWDGRLFAAPKTFDILAKDTGQVFGVALDDQPQPNIYVAATSAFGLNIVVRGRDGLPERRKKGGPGAGWMKGQFGLDLQGGPGGIYRIDGRTGVVSLLANVTLDGVPNPGPGLGNLAYDSEHKQLFVSDLYTGMIHRIDLDGKDLGNYDHGIAGLGADNRAPVPFNPRNRPNIASERFDSETPETWGFAPAGRQVWGLAVHQGRLFYSVAAGPQIWSVGIRQDGGFASDPRWELDIPSQPRPLPISDIAFSQQGAMILAQRASIAGNYDYSAFTRPGEPQVLRFLLKAPNDTDSPGRWQPAPAEYPVGLAGNHRNTNGGIALGYGYGPDGMLDTAACASALWTTGQNLRNNPALRSQLEPGGPLLVTGLQGSPADSVRNANVPPATSYFIDYDDKLDDARASGHMGSVRILARPCPTPVADSGSPSSAATTTISIDCVGPDCRKPPVCVPTCVCPQGTVPKDGECVKPPDSCPEPLVPGAVPGSCVCPPGTVLHGKECVRVTYMCQPPMVPNSQGTACVCPQGTVLLDGKCVASPPHECRPPLVPGIVPGTCVCPQGTVLNGKECVPQVCPSPMVAGPCECPPGTVQDGRLCVELPKDCPPPMVPGAVPGSCICPPGTLLHGKECVKVDICPPPMVPGAVPGSCICPPGTLLHGKECVKVDICPPPMVPGAVHGSCICPPGTVLHGRECVKVDICPPPMVPGAVPGSCICPPGSLLHGKECVKVDICPPPMVPGAVPGSCVCPPGTVQKGKECVRRTGACPAGLVKRGSRCVEPVVCRAPAKLNRRGTGCTCPPGMALKGNTCIERERRPQVIAPERIPRIDIPGMGPRGPRGGQDGPGGLRGGGFGGGGESGSPGGRR